MECVIWSLIGFLFCSVIALALIFTKFFNMFVEYKQKTDENIEETVTKRGIQKVINDLLSVIKMGATPLMGSRTRKNLVSTGGVSEPKIDSVLHEIEQKLDNVQAHRQSGGFLTQEDKEDLEKERKRLMGLFLDRIEEISENNENSNILQKYKNELSGSNSEKSHE